MTTTTIEKRSLFDVVFREPLELAAAQPHQVLLSTGSVAIMAQFAAHSGIVHPFVGYCIAAGVEWAYLRGLASDGRAPGVWGGRLNWSAFGVVVLWGVLWVALLYGVIPEKPTGALGWALAAVHIMPIAWLSLCSAMCHRAAHAADVKRADAAAAREAERAAELQRQRDAIALEAERERARIALEAERTRERLLLWQQKQEMTTKLNATAMPKKIGIVPSVEGKTARCKLCQNEVAYSTASEAGTIRRWGCEPCRAAKKEG